MSRAGPHRELVVVTAVVVVCATLVSAAVVLLRPLQLDHRLLDRARNVLQLTSGAEAVAGLGDEALLQRFRALDARVVDLAAGRFEPGLDPYALEARQAGDRAEQGRPIPQTEDHAGLGLQPRRVVVYLDWGVGGLERLVFPVEGMGMWSTIRGFVALEPDLDTIAAAAFHEQAETPGVGDRITRPDWLAKWRGRRIYGDDGVVQFAIAPGPVAAGSASALHHVDGLSGATVTADAVTALVQFWFGPWGYRPLLERLRAEPPQRPSPAPETGP